MHRPEFGSVAIRPPFLSFARFPIRHTVYTFVTLLFAPFLFTTYYP